MKKITFCLHDDTISFKYRAKKIEKSDLLNTNIIYDNELIFSDDYIKENTEIVSLFLLDLYKDYNIKKYRFSCNEIAELLLDTFKYIPKVDLITLKEDTFLPYSLYEKIVKYDNVKAVSCFSIPAYIVELLDKKNIKAETRCEMLFTSQFMENNNLNTYGQLYYKNSVTFKGYITPDDLSDFKVFCTINKYLKVIHIDNYSYKDILSIIQVLYSNRKKNVVIQIHDDITEDDKIQEISLLNKKIKKNYKLSMELVYSEDYLESNYSKQLIFTTLKYCSLIIFCLLCTIVGYLSYNNYKSEKEVNEITTELKALLEDDSRDYDKIEDPYIEAPPLEQNPIEEGTVNIEAPVEEPKKNSIYVNNYDRLLTVNPDTIGWLKVNNTKIDYPVVKSYNNDYYLTHDYYKRFTYNGWVFMDYRSDPRNLGRNTIIFGHNRYNTGVIFGSLSRVLDKNWQNNSNNLIISFNTLYREMKWKIFSVYTIDVTSDYLQTTFDTDEEYQEFLDKIISRSETDFGTTVTVNDNILTLSTCHDEVRRLVVHAVRID